MPTCDTWSLSSRGAQPESLNLTSIWKILEKYVVEGVINSSVSYLYMLQTDKEMVT